MGVWPACSRRWTGLLCWVTECRENMVRPPDDGIRSNHMDCTLSMKNSHTYARNNHLHGGIHSWTSLDRLPVLQVPPLRRHLQIDKHNSSMSSQKLCWKLCKNMSLLQCYLYLRVSLHCPASGTWKLQKEIKRSDSPTTESTDLTVATRYAGRFRLPDNVRLRHCCLRRHEVGKRIDAWGRCAKNHHPWNCLPPRDLTGCLQRGSHPAACQTDLLGLWWTPVSDWGKENA